MVILKVQIKVDQGTSTFWMHGPLGVKAKIRCQWGCTGTWTATEQHKTSLAARDEEADCVREFGQ